MFDADRETGAQVWQTPAGLLPLGADEVQVWRISLAEALAGFEFYRSLLSADELERAGRYIVAHPPERVSGRAWLSADAAGACAGDRSPGCGVSVRRAWQAGVGAGCRSRVQRGACEGCDPDRAASGRTSGGGCRVDRSGDGDAGACGGDVYPRGSSRSFAAPRRGRERLLTFYRCWTQKEAVTKADGRGLTLSPMTFEVPIFDGVEAVLQSGAGVASSAKVCEQIYGVFPLRMGEDYLGTLATCTPCGDVLSCWFPLPRTEQHPVTGAPHQRLRAFLSVQRLASTGSHRQRARSNLHKLQGPFWVVQEGNSFWLPICIRREHKVGME